MFGFIFFPETKLKVVISAYIQQMCYRITELQKIEESIAHTAEDFRDVLLLLPLSPFFLSLCHWKKVSFQYSLSLSTVTLCKFSQFKHYQQLFLKGNTSTIKQMNAQGFGLFLLHQLMLHLVVNSNKNHSVKCHWNALSQVRGPFAHSSCYVLPT